MYLVIQAALLIACLVALMTLSYLLRQVLSRAVRRDWLFYLLLAPGTIVHELCHLVACLVTLTRVYEVHLFQLRREGDGTVQLGEVEHANTDPIRNFLIAMAPLLGASLLIYGLSVWLLPKNESWEMLLRSGWTYLFLVIVFFIALGLSPSRQDLKALPAFLITVSVVGLVGYIVVLAFPKSWNLSGAGRTVEASLKTANTGLVFVLVVVAVVLGVSIVVERVFCRC